MLPGTYSAENYTFGELRGYMTILPFLIVYGVIGLQPSNVRKNSN